MLIEPSIYCYPVLLVKVWLSIAQVFVMKNIVSRYRVYMCEAETGISFLYNLIIRIEIYYSYMNMSCHFFVDKPVGYYFPLFIVVRQFCKYYSLLMTIGLL